jgi:hypothetical protein
VARMEHGAGWGSRAARNGVRDGEDSNSERSAQQHAMGEHESERYFVERDWKTHRGRRHVRLVARKPEKRRFDDARS